jgi:hypothetical protein
MPTIIFKSSCYLFIVLGLLLVVTACGSGSNQADIVGKWQAIEIVNGGQTTPIKEQGVVELQFYKGDSTTLNVNVPGSPITISDVGTYKFVDDNSIRIDMPPNSSGIAFLTSFISGNAAPLASIPTAGIYNVQVSADRLTLSSENEGRVIFKRTE